MSIFPFRRPVSMSGGGRHPVSSRVPHADLQSTPQASPAADSPMPARGDEQWTAWGRAVLEEARQTMDEISSRRWMVVHPADTSMLALLAQIDGGGWKSGELEAPRVLRWLSKMDRRVYTLVEFLSLTRQPDPHRISPKPRDCRQPESSPRPTIV